MFRLDTIVVVTLVLGLSILYRRAERHGRFPLGGWVALGVIGLVEILNALEAPLVGTLFMPIMMSAYVVAVDSAVYALRGRSLIRSRTEAFVWMAILSIFGWVVFEIYNEQIAAWHYGGWPNNEARYILLGWCFATVWPAIFVSADFFQETLGRRTAEQTTNSSSALSWIAVGAGGLCLLAPFAGFGIRSFFIVVFGFLAVTDALNYRGQLPSLWGDCSAGWRLRLYSLLGAGPTCGIIWAFWNTRPGARLYSTGAHVGLLEMQVEAFLGMAIFGPAAFAIYVFAASRFGLPLYESGARQQAVLPK